MVTLETLEKQYNELVNAARELVQVRESSDVTR